MDKSDFLQQLEQRRGLNVAGEMVEEGFLTKEEAADHLIAMIQDNDRPSSSVLTHAESLFENDIPGALNFFTRAVPYIKDRQIDDLFVEDALLTILFEDLEDEEREVADKQFINFAHDLYKNGHIDSGQLANMRNAQLTTGAEVYLNDEIDLVPMLYADAQKLYENPDMTKPVLPSGKLIKRDFIEYNKQVSVSPTGRRTEILNALSQILHNKESLDDDLFQNTLKLLQKAHEIGDIKLSQYFSNVEMVMYNATSQQIQSISRDYLDYLAAQYRKNNTHGPDEFKEMSKRDFLFRLGQIIALPKFGDDVAASATHMMIEIGYDARNADTYVEDPYGKTEEFIAKLPQEQQGPWIEKFVTLIDEKWDSGKWELNRILDFASRFGRIMPEAEKVKYLERVIAKTLKTDRSEFRDWEVTEYYEFMDAMLARLPSASSELRQTYNGQLLQALNDQTMTLPQWLKRNLAGSSHVPQHQRFEFYKSLVNDLEGMTYDRKASTKDLYTMQFDLALRARKYAQTEEDRDWTLRTILSSASTLGLDMSQTQRSNLRDIFRSYNGSERLTNGLLVWMPEGKNQTAALAFPGEDGKQTLVDFFHMSGSVDDVGAIVESRYLPNSHRRKLWDAFKKRLGKLTNS